MKKIIELNDFRRREAVEMFSTFSRPNLTLTCEVECTGARERAKKMGTTFSLFYTHALLQAANEIEEFRYRIDMEGRIVLYDSLNTLILVNIGHNGAYVTLPLTYIADHNEFFKESARKIELIKADIHHFKHENEEMRKELNHFVISAAPCVSFVSNSLIERTSWRGFFPLSCVGRMVLREGKEYIPVAITVSHAFVDGHHIGRFFDRVQELLTENTLQYHIQKKQSKNASLHA